MNTSEEAIDRILRLPEALRMTGRSKSRWYDDISAGRAPKPIKLGPRAVGWLESEIRQWLADRVACRDVVENVR